ncbi:MAG TPA: Ig-like domain-containing protein [Candidatus Eisenbacteria bacterium]|nr:Ig-like domain-containing protein [Candidatus Eisenbacteria bacterium]
MQVQPCAALPMARFPRIASVLAIFPVALAIATAQVSVLTHHNDNSRTGQNVSEPYLAPSNVNKSQFGVLFTQPVDGMVVAEPLYVPNLQINGTQHNVVFVVTLHDGVYAFDADNSTGANVSPLWYTSLINPPAVTTVPIASQGCLQTGFTEMGILGTPVINPTTNTMYLVAKTLESGKYVFRLHALNILTGQESLGGPVEIQASYTVDGKHVSFAQRHRMQRPALLLANGVVYIAFGTMGCRTDPPSTGWVMAYNASTLQQLATLDVGPSQTAVPGIWMSGDGPSVDSQGNVYLATGDGAFDYNVGGLDFGDTLMKLSLQSGSFDVADYFTPYNQADLDQNDLDLGSGGLVLLPTQPGPFPNLGIIVGKGTTLYLVNLDNLGQYNPLVDQVVQEVPFESSTPTEILGGVTYWNQLVYLSGGHNAIEAFSVTNGLLSATPVLKTSQNYNFPSLFSLSANGQQNGILWGTEQVFNGATDLASVLGVFKASNLQPLYGSPSSGTHTVAPGTSLNFPMVVNGKVYLGTQVNVTVFGLFAKIKTFSGSNQKGAPGTKLPQPLRARVTDAYTGNASVGVSVSFSDAGSGGTFSNPTAVTNSNGVASTAYTLPNKAGVYSITATGTAVTTTTFTETATAAQEN